MIIVETLPCTVCHKTSRVPMSEAEHRRFKLGERIGTIFPDKTPGERELLITGTHDECWDSMFGAEDMDDD